MDIPVVSYNAEGPLLRELYTKGFDVFIKASSKCFAELIGGAILYHNLDSTQPPPRHLCEWMDYLSPIADMHGKYHRTKDRSTWRELKDRVLSVMAEKIPTQITSAAVRAGVAPDRANKDVMETIAAAFRVVIVWYEVIEEEIVTRLFYRAEQGTCLFYIYFASEGGQIIAAQHPSMMKHSPDEQVPSCSISLPPRPIIVGRPEIDVPLPSAEWPSQFISLLIRIVGSADPNTLPENLRRNVEGYLESWEMVKEQIQKSPLAGIINLEETKENLQKVVGVATPPPPLPLPSPPSPPKHPLAFCSQIRDYPSDYISHYDRHEFHVSCLAEYFLMAINNSPCDNVIKCPRCPRPFPEDMILQVLPHFSTIKNEAMRLWQQKTTEKL